jgi:hypothetical protein
MPGDQIPHSILPSAEIGTAPTQLNTMPNPDRTVAVETQQAIYFFFVYTEKNLAQVTKLIRKGHKGYDQSTSLSLAGARKLYAQLANS